MRFITGIAVRNRTVTVLAIIIVLTSGIFAYNSLRVELFPEIEFPLVTVTTSYPSANPDAVVRDVTAPIERAISGTGGLESVQSTTFEGNSLVLATFTYGTDMANAANQIEAAVNNISFVGGVEEPSVGRFNPDQFPVIQFSVISDRNPAELEGIIQSSILPAISDIEGVLQVRVAGEIEQRVQITADPDRMTANGVSLFQISSALRDNNVSLPAGAIFDGRQAVLAKTTHTFNSIDDLKSLVVGMSESEPVLLGDVADVSLGAAAPRSISRTNGKPSVGVSVIKEAEANTIDVTTAVQDALDGLGGLPSDLEIVIVSNQGPSIQSQIDALLREAMFGFLFAVTVVFAFMVSFRPTILRGLFNTLRPTIVIAMSIPMSIFTGVLLMSWQDLSLNFMTLGGLAISVGRVVDDAIVVLENVYRHIQAGRERWRAALEATAEVGPAIFASTMTTIVVFAPLAFIQGLVGAFFAPFALTVSFALVASLLVALTAVPVLGAYLLRPGDLPDAVEEEEDVFLQETWMQRLYTPIIRWTLRHKAITVVSALVLTLGSMGMTFFIPVTLFSGGGERYLQIEVGLPPGTPPDRTLAEVIEIEEEVQGFAEVYSSTIGSSNLSPDSQPGGLNQANLLINLVKDAPEDIDQILRDDLDKEGRTLRIREIVDGPPTGGVEISITGSNYDDITGVARELTASLGELKEVINLESDVAQARDEASIQVDPGKAARIGLSTRQVGLQLSQYLVGETVTRITIGGTVTDVVLSGNRSSANGIGALENLTIAGPIGSAPLGELAEVVVSEGPVTISRTDGMRSATITGDIVAEDTQAVGPLGRREDIGALTPSGRLGFQWRHIRRHRRGIPGHLYLHGRRDNSCVSGNGGQPGVSQEPLRHHNDAAVRAHWGARRAAHHRPHAWPACHDGNPASHRHRGDQRHSADSFRRAAAGEGNGSLRRADQRWKGTAAPDSDDSPNDELRAAAPGCCFLRRRDHQRRAGDCGDRRSDELHRSYTHRSAGGIQHIQREHSAEVPANGCRLEPKAVAHNLISKGLGERGCRKECKIGRGTVLKLRPIYWPSKI